MRKQLGKSWGATVGPFLQRALLLFLFSPAICHAQTRTWYTGQTYSFNLATPAGPECLLWSGCVFSTYFTTADGNYVPLAAFTMDVASDGSQASFTVEIATDVPTEKATFTFISACDPANADCPGETNAVFGQYSFPVQIESLSAIIKDTSDIMNGTVEVKLSAPEGTTGDLVPVFHGTDASGAAIQYGPEFPALAPGTQQIQLPFDDPPPAIYTTIDGAWYATPPGASTTQTVDIPTYTMPTPWTYFRKVFYTQYNFAHENACSGGDADAWVVSASTSKGTTTCSFTKISLNAQFISAVWINGTGVDNNGDILRMAMVPTLGSGAGQKCFGQYPLGAIGVTPKLPNGKNGSGNTFVIAAPPITGSCSGQSLVPDQSLAMPCSRSGKLCPPAVLSGVKALSCGDQLNLDSGDYATASTRSADDKCPACSDTGPFNDVNSVMYGADGHIDAFSSNTSCTGKGVGSLGFFYTSYPTN